MDVGGLKVEWKNGHESCVRPLHLFLVTKKEKIWVEGVKKNRPQTEKTSAFNSAGSDQFHIGPCTGREPPPTSTDLHRALTNSASHAIAQSASELLSAHEKETWYLDPTSSPPVP